MRPEGIDAQFTLMNAWPERCECCVWRAQSFFSCAGFARDQHGGIGGGHFHNAGETVLQRR